MADDKHWTEIQIESWSFGSSNAAGSTAGDLKAPPMSDDAQGGGPHVKVLDGASGQNQPAPGGLSDEDGGGVEGKDHDKWINVGSVNMGGHKAGGGSSANAGGEHEMEYDLVAGQVADPEGEPEAIGSANGGVWKTTNFDTGSDSAVERSAPSISEIVVTKSTDSTAPIDGFLKVDEIDGESAVGGGKMHLEDISVAPTEPDPAGGIQVGLGDGSVRGVAPEPAAIELENVQITSYQLGVLDSNSAEPGDLTAETPTSAAAFDAFLEIKGIPGETDDSAHGAGGGGGAGKVSVHDISIMGEDDGPSSFAALEPDDEPEPYLEVKLQSVKVTSYSVNGSGLDDSDDGPSSMAPLVPDDAAERSGEQTYLAIKLENVQITSYSLNSEEASDDLDGGTEHEDSWEEVL